MMLQHRHAAHCESGVSAALLRQAGVDISEPMAFGLGRGLSFAYLPLIKMQGMPMVAYRSPPRAIIKAAAKPLGAQYEFKRFGSVQAGERALDAALDAGHIVGLQTSVFWLPYFPPDMRFHFNGHNLIVYGRDGDDYLISDPVFEDVVRCPRADLNRARFARGLLAPRGLMYFVRKVASAQVHGPDVLTAIRKTCGTMLAPVPIAGVKGIRLLAKKIDNLSVQDKDASLAFVGHVIRMQEEIGTGGAGFRFLYAAFLQEAAQITARTAFSRHADELLAIGDGWRAFALTTARMIRGREAFEPSKLAALLNGQADAELRFFTELRQNAQA